MPVIKTFFKRIGQNNLSFFKGLIGLSDILISYFIMAFMILHFGMHFLSVLIILGMAILNMVRTKFRVQQQKTKGISVETSLTLQLRVVLSIFMLIVPCLGLVGVLMNIIN